MYKMHDFKYTPKDREKEKNRIRPEYFKNYTNFTEQRCIVIDMGKGLNQNYFNELFAKVSSTTNLLIQRLNLMVHTRQIPYVVLLPIYDRKLDFRSRFIMRCFDTDKTFLKDIKKEYNENSEIISHIIDVLIAEGYHTITISTDFCDAKMVVDDNSLCSVLVDVLLDIVMFNSFSFLRELDNNNKRFFSYQKAQYFSKQKLPCFYEFEDKKQLKQLKYYSLAFSSRTSNKLIDLDKYISYWDDFIKKYYNPCIHHEMSIIDQLNLHVDAGELPKNDIIKMLKSRNSGAYLLLRTNKDRSDDLQEWICSLFNIKEYKKGEIQIVEIEKYESYKRLFENLDVSVFKIVVP